MSAALIGQDQTAGDVEVAETDGNVESVEVGHATDLKSRILAGGDFAWEQIQKRDRHSSELANKVKELEPIEQLVKFAGDPNRVFSLVDLGNRVAQNPELFQFVQNVIATGKLELPKAAAAETPDDEWMDPDAKKVRDMLTPKLSELEQRIAELTRVASGAELRANEQRIQTNIERALKDFEGNEEAFIEASKAINDRYKTAYRMAENGDAVQARLLDQLAGEGGREMLDAITAPIFRKHAAKLVGSSNTSTQNAAQALGRKATDERTVNPSRPAASPLPPLPKGRVSDSTVLNMFREIARRRGVNPDVL